MRVTLLALLLLSSCVIGGDQYKRPRDLEPNSLVNRARVLAIQADPPEARPGEAVRFTALFPDPHGEINTTLWFACTPEQSTSFGCALDFTGIDLQNATPDELAAAGLIGIEPLWTPTLSVPADALDGLSEVDKRDGVYWQAQLLGLPTGQPNVEEIDFNAVDSAHKRLIVSLSEHPNRNPTLSHFSVDGLDVDTNQRVLLDAGQLYRLEVQVPGADVERYAYLTPNGTLEERTEEPYIRWYASGGRYNSSTSLYPFLYTEWRAPDEPNTEGSFWAVIRDRRGGLGWIEQAYSVQ